MEEKLTRREVREGAFILLYQTMFAKYSTTRSVARISKVNLVLMKIAIYEMKYNDKVPGAAAINEAVELGKKYAYKQDCSFINGVLNSCLEEIENDRD